MHAWICNWEKSWKPDISDSDTELVVNDEEHEDKR